MATKAASHLRAARWVGGGWTFFIAENLVLSENRSTIIDVLGGDEQRYLVLYSGLSTLSCAAIGYGYLKGRRRGAMIGGGPPGALRQIAGLGLQAVGLVAAAQFIPKLQIPVELGGDASPALAPAPAPTALPHQPTNPEPAPATGFRLKCPMDFTPVDTPADGIYGVQRVTRHPQFWILGFVGLGAAVATPFLSEMVMFTMPAVFAVVGGLHQDSRFRRGLGGTLTPEVDAKTSAVPFAALITGKQSWLNLGLELKELNAALALTVAGLMAWRRRAALRPLLKLAHGAAGPKA